MSDSVTAPPIDEAPGRTRASRSFWSRVLRETMGLWGARVGAAWIGALALLAIFAPFIASSYPLLIKQSGHWSSPLIENIGVGDVVLLCATLAFAIVSFIRGLDGRARLLIVAAIVIVVAPISAQLIGHRPPAVYDKYRLAAAAGKVDFVLNAPIPYSPSDRLRDIPVRDVQPPWWAAGRESEARKRGHWLGTEANGSDVASRMIHACRTVLAVGFIATGIAITCGIIIGGLMGYFAGVVDLLGMRFVEIFEFIPTLILLLMVVAFFPGNPKILGVEFQRIYFMMAIIGLTSWSGYARFIRAEFFKLRKQDFVQAAVACGLPLRSILFRHMLPNGLTPVLVSASFGVASAILAESTLSFLGLGLVDEPSWGQLLFQTTGATGGFTWWIAVFPGAAIFLTVFAYTLIGEALRDAIDPHLKKSAQM